MQLLSGIKKIPGGLMIVPMFVTAIINTWAPGLLKIGGPTSGLFTSAGTMTVIGLSLFITGSQFQLSGVGKTLKRGGVFAVSKILIGYVAAFIAVRYWGVAGLLGVSSLAFVVTMVSTNPGVYLALMQAYGDDADRSSFGLFNVVAVPSTAIVIMGAASGTGINWMSVIAVLVPFLFGMLLGNVDPAIRQMMAPGTPIVLPFLGFSFGASVNLVAAAKAGPSGLLLTAVFLLVNVPLMLFVDRFVLKRPGYAGTAFCAVAGISVAIPTMIAATQPEFGPYVATATGQVALAVVVTSILIPYLTKIVVKAWGTGAEVAAQPGAEPATAAA